MVKEIKPVKQNDIADLSLFKEICALIVAARNAVVRNINAVQSMTSFEIGRRIVEHEQKGENRAEYGKALLKDLSDRLTKEFGKGFSRANIQNMRNFYIVYRDRLQQKCQMPSGKLIEGQKGQPVSNKSKHVCISGITQISSGELNKPVFRLSWSQYIFLIGIKDEDARGFYEIEAANNNWTLPELTRQFNSGLYERLVLSRDKDGVRKLAKEGQVVSKPKLGDVLKNLKSWSHKVLERIIEGILLIYT